MACAGCSLSVPSTPSSSTRLAVICRLPTARKSPHRSLDTRASTIRLMKAADPAAESAALVCCEALIPRRAGTGESTGTTTEEERQVLTATVPLDGGASPDLMGGA